MKRKTKYLIIIAGSIISLLPTTLLVLFFMRNSIIQNKIESELESILLGSVQIEGLNFDPFARSISIDSLAVIQDINPDTYLIKSEEIFLLFKQLPLFSWNDLDIETLHFNHIDFLVPIKEAQTETTLPSIESLPAFIAALPLDEIVEQHTEHLQSHAYLSTLHAESNTTQNRVLAMRSDINALLQARSKDKGQSITHNQNTTFEEAFRALNRSTEQYQTITRIQQQGQDIQQHLQQSITAVKHSAAELHLRIDEDLTMLLDAATDPEVLRPMLAATLLEQLIRPAISQYQKKLSSVLLLIQSLPHKQLASLEPTLASLVASLNSMGSDHGSPDSGGFAEAHSVELTEDIVIQAPTAPQSPQPPSALTSITVPDPKTPRDITFTADSSSSNLAGTSANTTETDDSLLLSGATDTQIGHIAQKNSDEPSDTGSTATESNAPASSTDSSEVSSFLIRNLILTLGIKESPIFPVRPITTIKANNIRSSILADLEPISFTLNSETVHVIMNSPDNESSTDAEDGTTSTTESTADDTQSSTDSFQLEGGGSFSLNPQFPMIEGQITVRDIPINIEDVFLKLNLKTIQSTVDGNVSVSMKDALNGEIDLLLTGTKLTVIPERLGFFQGFLAEALNSLPTLDVVIAIKIKDGEISDFDLSLPQFDFSSSDFNSFFSPLSPAEKEDFTELKAALKLELERKLYEYTAASLEHVKNNIGQHLATVNEQTEEAGILKAQIHAENEVLTNLVQTHISSAAVKEAERIQKKLEQQMENIAQRFGSTFF